MNEREYNVINASKNTCGWLSENLVYIHWFNQQHGLLWIKGHPGVGKSTLMKHVLKSNSMIEENNAIIISFFFHGRGNLLQKTPLGLFQSLLHQLALRCPDVLREINDIFSRKCKTQGEYGTKWEWYPNELEELFISQVKEATKTHIVREYIDALDECGEDAATHLVEIFQDVAVASSICFSCRHYPLVHLKDGLEIRIEDNNANDIRTYMSNRLDEQKNLAEIRDRIVEKASGNFQWVQIVAKLVIDWRRKGFSMKFIEKKVTSIPKELSQLYKELLLGIDKSEKAESLHLMQWICYALRPLSVTELRFAMVVDIDTTCQSIRECQESEQYVETDEEMENRVVHLSTGLAEVVWHGARSTVQLIHQSASDFLRDEQGLQLLHESQDWAPANSSSGHAHFRLSRSCIKYLSMKEILNTTELPNTRWALSHRENQPKNSVQAQASLESEFPFLEYATTCWISHAEIVEKNGVSQHDLISFFHSTSVWQLWIDAYHFLNPHSSECPSQESTLLHIASKHGFLSVLKVIHELNFSINATDSDSKTPLYLAVKRGHEAVVRWLLEYNDLDVNFADEMKRTALQLAVEGEHETITELLLKHKDVDVNSKNGRGETLLQTTISKKDTKMMEILLKHKDVDLNSKDYRGNTLLHWTINDRHTDLMEFLLKHKDVDVNSKNDREATPLHLSIVYGLMEMMKIVLKNKKVDVNSKNDDKDTPLHLTARLGRTDMIEILLKHKNVDVNSRNDCEDTPLHLTTRCGHKATMKLLLKRNEVDVNLKNKFGESPLHLMITPEYESVMKLLLDRPDVNVNSKNTYGNTPLHLMASFGHEELIRMLLNRCDTDVNCKNSEKMTPLHYAAQMGHKTATEMLLNENGIDVNSRNCYGVTPLYSAILNRLETIAELLLKRHDLDVTAKGYYGRTVLHWASRTRRDITLRSLLKREEIDVNIKDIDGETSLHLAVREGNDASMKLLLEHKADANIKNNHGLTSLHLTVITKHEESMRLLLKHNEDANIQDNNGNTFLHMTIFEVSERMIKLLLKQEVNPNVADNDGNTSLH